MENTLTPLEIIRAERSRQIEKEGWSKQHDDEHNDCQLFDAAFCYFNYDHLRFENEVPIGWPWENSSWNLRLKIG